MTRFLLRRPLPALAAALLVSTGCTTWQRVGDPGGTTPEQSLMQMFNPGPLYERLGRMVSTGDVAFIGTVAMVPGPADSVRGIIGVSLSNRAFAFERTGDQFVARYRVEYELLPEGGAPITVARDGVIRVGTLQEALRTDETLLLQQEIALLPGPHTVTVRVSDLGGAKRGSAMRRVTVPRFTPGTISPPMLVYQVEGRGQPSDSLRVVLNTRGSLAYGGDTLLVYVEGYRFAGPTRVPVEVRDETDSVIYRTNLDFTGASPVESQLVRLIPEQAPLGQLEVVVGSGEAVQRTSALVSFSGNWVVTNFPDLLSLLRYFGEDNRLSQMRDADPTDRIELWQEFFRVTDPNRSTPENEALDAYFARVAIANQRFNDEGIAGWRTDRGEVFITLGMPDESFDATPQNQGRFLQWSYNELRLVVLFQDPTGFGRFRLTMQSRADFERVRNRVVRPAM
jgi:GWxTD domain-containing protein